MKTFLLIALLFTVVGCQSNYIQTMDVADGKYITIRDTSHSSKVNDTLIIYNTGSIQGYLLYGKSLKYMPTSKYGITYRRVVRLQ